METVEHENTAVHSYYPFPELGGNSRRHLSLLPGLSAVSAEVKLDLGAGEEPPIADAEIDPLGQE